jgi:hypothetical protein
VVALIVFSRAAGMYGRRLPPMDTPEPRVRPPSGFRAIPGRQQDLGSAAPAPAWDGLQLGGAGRPARERNIDGVAPVPQWGNRPAQRPDADDDGGLMLGAPARRPDGDDDGGLMLGGPTIPTATLR